VLTEANLHWSAFVTLWCLWIYGELETRKLALEAGVAKSTLSGILNTLEAGSWCAGGPTRPNAAW